jgi:N-acetylglucosamine-6-sulfatase
MLGALVCLPCLAIAGCADERSKPAAPPNVVFLLVDDLRWDALGYRGYPVDTPNIDRLASEGVSFENAFVTTSLCTPSRASFITGMWAHAHRATGNLREPDYDATPSIASLLQAEGFYTALVGKWHMGVNSAPRPGYDRWHAFAGQGRYVDPSFNIDGETVASQGYNTDLLTDEAVRLVRDAPEPFFLQLGYKAVHDPLVPAPRHRGKYAGHDYGPVVRPNARSERQDLRARTAETLLGVDESIGRIYAALEESGRLDHTVVIFTSDNGRYFHEHGRGDKRGYHEESIRIPWIVRYPPRVAAGSTRERLVLNVDMAPSLLELVGAAVPVSMQGRSFWPVVASDTPIRDHFVYEYFRELQYPHMTDLFAVRTERYKYAVMPNSRDLFRALPPEPQLFDLEQDPYEMVNVIDDPALKAVSADLEAKLSAWIAQPGFAYPQIDRADLERRIRELYDKRTWFNRGYDEAHERFDPRRTTGDDAAPTAPRTSRG